ncbi:MAG: ABC transporter ATP-binding protein [Prochloraceae cyanobacterium]|nr:ABC transporter ATP-binding protein [Prochloraceae cyanobacterium]
MKNPLLEGRQISKSFQGLAAVKQVNLTVFTGEMMGLIGPNGSGKTTLFDCLCCLQPVDRGKIFFKGRNVTQARPNQLARMGLARTFQRIRIYRQMTVLENMLISRQWRGETLLDIFKSSHRQTKIRAKELLEFLLLSHLDREYAGNLSGGQQRLLEIGMALMPDPEIILLDEATSGINPTLINTIKERILILNQQQGKTFLIIEHNINFISDLCSRVCVLHQGEKLAEGTPDEIKTNKAVIEAYFGR